MTTLVEMNRTESDEELGAILAENLKRARLRAGLAQREVAAALDTNEMQVSRWERGTSAPHAVTLARLAALYRIPIDILYVKDHPMLPPPSDEKKISTENPNKVVLAKPAKPAPPRPRGTGPGRT